jgi:hypothetical protein
MPTSDRCPRIRPQALRRAEDFLEAVSVAAVSTRPGAMLGGKAAAPMETSRRLHSIHRLVRPPRGGL